MTMTSQAKADGVVTEFYRLCVCLFMTGAFPNVMSPPEGIVATVFAASVYFLLNLAVGIFFLRFLFTLVESFMDKPADTQERCQ